MRIKLKGEESGVEARAMKIKPDTEDSNAPTAMCY